MGQLEEKPVNHTEIERNKEYVVVLRAHSYALFTADSPFKIVNYPTQYGRINMTFYTKYEDLGLGPLIPRYLLADVRGPAPSLDAAIDSFSDAAISAILVISLSSNAYVDMPAIYVAYDNTPGCMERQYFQRYVQDTPLELEQARRTNSEVTAELFMRLLKNSNVKRLLRAIGQYHIALKNWKQGHEALAIVHLWMAMEVLTPVVRDRLCKQHGVDTIGLAAVLGIDKKCLDSEIRRRFLFKQDDDCYKKAHGARNGFEHGFNSFDFVRSLAIGTCDRAAYYVRTGILDLLNIEDSTLEILNSAPYEKPLMIGGIYKKLRGWIVGDTDYLLAEVQTYPFIEWHYEIQSATITESGNYTYTFTETVSPRFREGIQFKPESLGIWGPPEGFEKMETS